MHHVSRARFPAVDFHSHLGRWLSPDGGWAVSDVDALLTEMEKCNIRAVVNLDGKWGEELDENLHRYDLAHPGRFATFCHVDWGLTAGHDFPDQLAASLKRSAAAGAKGLKVWKELGLKIVDNQGKLLLPDDQRLGPLWDTAAECGLPVLIHTADPVAFFQPADGFNERIEELIAHPDWHFFGPGFPSFQRLMEALEAVVASHPNTRFIGAHVGGNAEDLAWVSRVLGTYPNFSVDIAARIAELGRQPRAARRMVLDHPDRVLFGSDVCPPRAAEYGVYFRFLETDDEHFPYSTLEEGSQGRWAISALDLPHDVLRRVYMDNALRLLPSLSG